MAKGIKRFLLIIVAACVLFIAYYGFAIVKFGLGIQDNQQSADDLTTNDLGSENEDEVYTPPTWEGTDRVNILLLGGDSRESTGNVPRTDTMLIVSIDPVTKQASLFSLLRDTYVQIPRHGYDRINSAAVYGGPNLAMETVSELTGLPIQYYVYVDFQGFIALVDAIGGVDYYVEKDMKYSSQADGPEYDIDLEEGMQKLDGKKALQYVRFRHDALSDYARTERQRNFLKAVAEQVQSTINILKLPNILNKIEPYIETNLSLNQMARLGTLAFQVDTSTISSNQLPPNHLLREETINGANVITVDPSSLQAFIQESFNSAMAKDNELTDHHPSNTES